MKTYKVELTAYQIVEVEANSESEALYEAERLVHSENWTVTQAEAYNYHGLDNLIGDNRMDAPKRGATCPVSSKHPSST